MTRSEQLISALRQSQFPFLDGLIRWTAIAEVLKDAMTGYDGTIADSVDVVIEADRRGRERARVAVERRTQAA